VTHAAAETPDGDTISTFDKFGFMPRVGLSVPATRDMATMILGQQIAMPIGISPVAVQAITYDSWALCGGDVAASGSARA
jgi:isopentenyl diphosphate isomerase/L-lactate dehydrogenase-like FMN-dependent dehydrogenase